MTAIRWVSCLNPAYGLDIDEFSQVRIEASEAEIKLERDMVRHLMP
jgi:hypothetical protein